MPAETPALTVEKMHKRFGQLEVLKGISLIAKDGDVISILGSSGEPKRLRMSLTSRAGVSAGILVPLKQRFVVWPTDRSCSPQ